MATNNNTHSMVITHIYMTVLTDKNKRLLFKQSLTAHKPFMMVTSEFRQTTLEHSWTLSPCHLYKTTLSTNEHSKQTCTDRLGRCCLRSNNYSICSCCLLSWWQHLLSRIVSPQLFHFTLFSSIFWICHLTVCTGWAWLLWPRVQPTLA